MDLAVLLPKFERLVPDFGRFAVGDRRRLPTGDDPRERLPRTGDAFRDREFGDDEREPGREEGRDDGRERESYGVT